MILADMGATVVHIDPPNGPMWISPANAILQRNKMIVTIDLKTPEGLEQAYALVEEADIIVESFRPGVMTRMGLYLYLVLPQTMNCAGTGEHTSL